MDETWEKKLPGVSPFMSFRLPAASAVTEARLTVIDLKLRGTDGSPKPQQRTFWTNKWTIIGPRFLKQNY